MSSWFSYPSIYNLGHRAVRDLLNVPHVIEEKVDGSQFSFGLLSNHEDHSEDILAGEPLYVSEEFELRVRSKGAVMLVGAPEKMFTKAVESVKERAHLLHRNWTYRAEYLAKPKHNTLAYDRIPIGHLVIFDVSTGDNEWLGPAEKRNEAERIGLECVPTLASSPSGATTTLETLRVLLDTHQSFLGGQLIEGVVIKPLVELYGPDHKTLMGKFVSERFKEAHREAWKVTSPNSGDVLDQLCRRFKTEGRWLKAIQHLREAGQLQEAPQDIPALLAEIQRDLGQEEKEEIQKLLWKWAWPHVARNVTRGFPEFWKETLLKQQFTQESSDGDSASTLGPTQTPEARPNYPPDTV